MLPPHVPTSGAFANRPPSVERYTCLDRLGVGGMGQVWRAHDQVLHRDVALKTVPLDAPDDHVERLQQEARIAAQLHDPGVVRILDQATMPDGRPFIVMELLRTPALGRGKERDLATLVQVARAVGEAHRQGIVHRDLKPSNLALRGTHGVVLDWGLARPVDTNAGWAERVLTRTTPVTRSGVSLGTPGYMAPEQVAGAHADPRSDVWSLAAMVHEVLSGSAAHAEGGHRLLAAISEGRLWVPRGPLGDLLRRALSLDPGERPPDAHAFAEALTHHTAEPSRAWRGWLAAGAVCLVAFAAGVGWSGGPAERSSDGSKALADLHAAHGWSLHASGRTMEAVAHAAPSLAAMETPLGRGLAMIVPPPEPRVQQVDCEQLVHADGSPLSLCVRGDDILLLEHGVERWRRPRPRGAWVGLDRVVVQDGWNLVEVGADGRERRTTPVRTAVDALVVDDDRSWKVVGPFVGRVFDVATSAYHIFEGNTPSIGAAVEEGLVFAHHDRVYVLSAEGPRDLGPFGEPLVYGGTLDGEVWLVGLRGLVVCLDASTLDVRRRYRLEGVRQVEDAAWNGHVLVASTPDGVFAFRGAGVEHQLLEGAGYEVDALPSGAMVARRDGQSWQWDLDRAASRALVDSGNTSVTALSLWSDPAFAAGSWIYRFDPDTLSAVRSFEMAGGPIRSLPVFPYAVDGFGLYRIEGRTRDLVGRWPVAVSLSSGTVVGARRFSRGVAVLRGEDVHVVPDAPMVRSLAIGHGGQHALGVSQEGEVLRIRDDGTVSDLGLEGVDVVASGALGTVVARDTEVSLVDGWTADVGQEITALAVDGSWVVVGTRGGEVLGFDGEGALDWHLHAHPEQISGLAVWGGDTLFTSSWAPGVRRWRLPDAVSP